MRGAECLSVRLDVAEEGGQPVIVFLRNRVEHVVVTAGTAHRQPQEGGARRADHLVDFVPSGRRLVVRLVVPNSQSIKAGGDDRFGRRLVELVAGQLLDDEAVVGLVGIERVDDVVAIPPRLGLFGVAFVAVGLREAGDVEPVPAPTLAVFFPRQQIVDQSPVCLLATDSRRTRRLLPASAAGRSRRRTARRISTAGLGRRIRREALFLEPRQNERVDRIGRPVFLRTAGGCGWPTGWKAQ